MTIQKQTDVLTKISENLFDSIKKIEELREMARVRDPKTCLSPKAWMLISDAEKRIEFARTSIISAIVKAKNEFNTEAVVESPVEKKNIVIVNPAYECAKDFVTLSEKEKAALDMKQLKSAFGDSIVCCK